MIPERNRFGQVTSLANAAGNRRTLSNCSTLQAEPRSKRRSVTSTKIETAIRTGFQEHIRQRPLHPHAVEPASRSSLARHPCQPRRSIPAATAQAVPADAAAVIGVLKGSKRGAVGQKTPLWTHPPHRIKSPSRPRGYGEKVSRRFPSFKLRVSILRYPLTSPSIDSFSHYVIRRLGQLFLALVLR